VPESWRIYGFQSICWKPLMDWSLEFARRPLT
jgi:hypothetical protein